jgi:hypothetical protein
MSSLECTGASLDYAASHIAITAQCPTIDSDMCRGIFYTQSTGQWGSYTFCNHTEQASWVLNQVFISKNRDPAACTSAGGALQQPTKTEQPQEDCSVYLKQIGPDGLGNVTVTPTPMSSTHTKEGSGGLSTGLRAAIAVSVTVFLLFLLSIFGALWFCLRRRRQRAIQASEDAKKNGLEAEQSSSANDNGKNQQDGLPLAELDGEVVPMEIDGLAKVEMDTNGPVELEGGERLELEGDHVPELQGQKTVAELEGSKVTGKQEDRMAS